MSRSKYHAKKVKDGGYTFDSQAEHRRWKELWLLQMAGQISGLAVHPVFHLMVNGERVGNYIGDFLYYLPDNTRVVEDVKGVLTPIYRLKKKLMKAIHGIDIVEVKA